MSYTNIFGKIYILIKLLIKYKLIFILVLFHFFLIILYFKNKISKKKLLFYSLFIFAVLFIYYFMINNKFLTETINNLINNIFKNIYFPSIYFLSYIYIFMLLYFILKLLKSVKRNISIKFDYIIFFIINLLTIIFVVLISENKINILSKKSLYTNNDILIILQLYVITFIIWLFIKIVNIISDKLYHYFHMQIKENNIKDVQENELIENNNKTYEDNALSDKISTKKLIIDNSKVNKIKGNISNIDMCLDKTNNIDMLNLNDNTNFFYKEENKIKDEDLITKNTLMSKLNNSKQTNLSKTEYNNYINMLNVIKCNIKSNNVSITKAMLILLTNNYNTDECLKFLEVVMELRDKSI